MLISGIQKISLIDFPDTPACIVFTPGCNFRCGMCHNPEFVLPEEILKIKDSFIPEGAVLRFLRARKGMLEGVVITGGEPTIQGDLLTFMKKIRDEGLKIKLDSNGARPEILEQVIEQQLVDYIAMDLKHIPEKYQGVSGRCVQPEKIRSSIRTIVNSGVDHEFRTTVIKEIHTPEIMKKMAREVEGAQNLYLQAFRPGKTLDPAYGTLTTYKDAKLTEFARDIFSPHVMHADVRI